MSNLNNATFVSLMNYELNNKNIGATVTLLANLFVIENLVEYDMHRHNPYQIIKEVGLSEEFIGPVDVTDPIYVKYVNDIRGSINTLAATIKVINTHLNGCHFNKWYDNVDFVPHNFHKFLHSVRRELVTEYQELIALRRYWKKMYKLVRAAEVDSKTVH